jgi:hypothetical protein
MKKAHKGFVRIFALVVALGALALMSRAQAFTVDDDETPRWVSFRLPDRASLRSSVLAADLSVEVGPRARIAASGGQPAWVVSLGGRPTEVGKETEIVGIVSKPGVLLGASTLVTGDITTAGNVTLGRRSSVQGAVLERAALDPISTFSWAVDRQGGPNVRVESNRTKLLSPGAFGSVTVLKGGRLKLQPGVYRFDSFYLQKGAVVELPESGQVIANIFDNWQSMGTWDNPGGAANTLFVFFGNEVRLDRGFIGTVVASSAQVEVGPASFTGAIFAKEIEVNSGATVTHSPFRSWGAVVGSEPLPIECTANNLRVTDLQADFRDIWAGREQLATGKRTEALPEIGLTFSEPVEPRFLAARLVGLVGAASSDCVRANGVTVAPSELHEVSLAKVNGATERDVVLKPTTRLSRLHSSTTVRHFSERPSARVSKTKSIAHTWLGLVAGVGRGRRVAMRFRGRLRGTWRPALRQSRCALSTLMHRPSLARSSCTMR